MEDHDRSARFLEAITLLGFVGVAFFCLLCVHRVVLSRRSQAAPVLSRPCAYHFW